jgi:hypothetical protein
MRNSLDAAGNRKPGGKEPHRDHHAGHATGRADRDDFLFAPHGLAIETGAHE